MKAFRWLLPLLVVSAITWAQISGGPGISLITFLQGTGQSGNASALNVCAFAGSTCGDTVSIRGNVTCANGSPTITVTVSLPSSYIGANAVVGGCGLLSAQETSAVTTGQIVVTAGGSGYAAGDTVTLTGGTCSTATVLKVLTVNAGVITAASVNPGSDGGDCTVAPTSPISQGSTSGSGSGATFTITYVGKPLTGTITAVGTNQFTMSANAVAAVTTVSEFWAVGHDDAPAINACLAAGPASCYLPAQQVATWSSSVFPQYGQYTQISFPTSRKFTLIGGGQILNALASMSAQIKVPLTTFFWSSQGGGITDLTLDSLGQASYNLDNETSLTTFHNIVGRNALTHNFYINHNGGGNTQNVIISDSQVHNDTLVVPAGASGYLIYDQVGNSDNRINNFTGDGSITGGIFFGGSDLVVTTSHLYLIFGGPDYDIEATYAEVTAAAADNVAPGQTAFYFSSSATLGGVDNWHVNQSVSQLGQFGVQLVSGALRNTVGCGTFGATVNINASANIVSDANTASTNVMSPCVSNFSTTGLMAHSPSVTICQSGTPVTHTGTTSEFNLTNCTVPGGVLGLQGMLRITILFQYTNNADTKTLIVRYNSTSGNTSTNQLMSVAVTTTVLSQVQIFVRNQNATNSQVTMNNNLLPFGSTATVPVTSTIDTTAQSFVNINCADTTSSADTCGIYGYTVEAVVP